MHLSYFSSPLLSSPLRHFPLPRPTRKYLQLRLQVRCFNDLVGHLLDLLKILHPVSHPRNLHIFGVV